jgi:hypothetical protein
MNCLALELYTVQKATDTLNQLGSTSPELLGSDEDHSHYRTLNYAPELGLTLYILWQVSRL